MNYYNEHDPKMAAWLRELIRAGVIPQGEVDERSIVAIKPTELSGFTQCHFFAGVGGWSEALRLDGWPSDRPVWTGSCPCQPFSCAGTGLGIDDERHLWPAFFRLISECRPSVVIGEQVASPAAIAWLDGVFDDLEGAGYACGASDLCAPSVGAPHIRQRLYWVANAGHQQAGRAARSSQEKSGRAFGESSGCRDDGRLEHASGDGREQRRSESGGGSVAGGCGNGTLAYALSEGLEVRHIEAAREELAATQRGGADFWNDFELIPCADGKTRRTKPGIFPLAYGVSGRVGLLRGAGNAIVPQVAAEFIKAAVEAMTP